MYDQEYQRIEVQIRNGLYQLEDSIFSYLSANEAVLLAEQARDQAQEKLEYGRISTLEYRDSVNQLSLAKNLRNRASFDLIAAYYELRYATGMDAGLDSNS
jgi:outer membrane protein TolC